MSWGSNKCACCLCLCWGFRVRGSKVEFTLSLSMLENCTDGMQYNMSELRDISKCVSLLSSGISLHASLPSGSLNPTSFSISLSKPYNKFDLTEFPGSFSDGGHDDQKPTSRKQTLKLSQQSAESSYSLETNISRRRAVYWHVCL